MIEHETPTAVPNRDRVYLKVAEILSALVNGDRGCLPHAPGHDNGWSVVVEGRHVLFDTPHNPDLHRHTLTAEQICNVEWNWLKGR